MKALAVKISRVQAIVLFGICLFLFSSQASAGICDGVPNCQEQTKSWIHFKALETKGYAYYCTGSHPYYWNNGPALGFGNNWKFKPSCYSVTENVFGETTKRPSKADFTITNWCHHSSFPFAPKSEHFHMILGCSQLPQDSDPPCKKNLETVKDPKCPLKGKVSNNCSDDGTACIQTYEEKCSDGKEYYCTLNIDIDERYCLVCPD